MVVRSLVTLGHLGRWLERNVLAVDQLTARGGERLPGRVSGRSRAVAGSERVAALEYLRAEGAVPSEPPAVVAPVEQLVGEYREWLVWERGLAPVKVHAGERFALRFLAGRVCAGIRAAGWGSRPARSTHSSCASARG